MVYDSFVKAKEQRVGSLAVGLASAQRYVRLQCIQEVLDVPSCQALASQYMLWDGEKVLTTGTWIM